MRVLDERDLALSDWTAERGLGVRSAATHHLGNDKRTAVDAAAQHLLAHAPTPQALIALGDGAPFGEIAVDADRCTMCLACVGSCPEGALSDNAEVLQLRFIEAKCVQCGLCAKTCPEKAIQLTPRLNLDASAKRPRVLNQAELAECTRCGKSLGPRKLLDNMRARLSGHSMFADDKARARLMMCGGRLRAIAAPTKIARASAATMPSVEPIHTPNQLLSVASAIASTISSSCERKNATLGMKKLCTHELFDSTAEKLITSSKLRGQKKRWDY